MSTVVAYRPVTAVGACDRVPVEVGDSQPGEVLADLGGVRAAGLLTDRRGLERADVLVEHDHVRPVQLDRRAPSPTRLRVF